jgi:cytochrome c-type biogenesis protein CcmH
MKLQLNILSLRTLAPLAVLSLALLWLILPTPINSQDAPNTPDADAVTPNQVNEVAKELWCPLCSGVRLDSCELKACDQMKDVIAIKLAEGENTESIRDYFVQQYGPQVLGEPPREGFNWLAWILPFAALLGGAAFLWFKTKKMFGPQPQLAEGEDHAIHKGEESAKDEYQRKLEEELDEYG